MKILVTGGTGLIGSQLLCRLSGDHEVFALTRRSEAPELDADVEWMRQDLAGPLDCAELPGAIDAVIHLAQSERYRDFPEGAEDIFAVNVYSTHRLLEYARSAGASRFILASTGGLYPFRAAPIDEGARLAPAGPYFRSKRMAELLVEDYGDLLSASVMRFFFVYGPGGKRTLVPRFAAAILGDEEIVLEGDPGLRINPVYSDDAAGALEAALELDGGATVNVAGDEVVSTGELARRLAGALGRDTKLSHRGTSPEGDLVADTSLMRSRLGFTPSVGLDEGLRRVAAALVSRDESDR